MKCEKKKRKEKKRKEIDRIYKGILKGKKKLVCVT